MNIKTRIKELAAKSEAVREFAAGDQILKLGFKAANAKGVYRPEALAMAGQLHGPILATALAKKGGAWNKAQRKASAYQIREYRGVMRRGKDVTEFARGDYAIPAMRKILDAKRKSQPTFWPSTLEGMQPHYRNRYAMPPDGTFVPSLKFSGKDPLWSQRKVTEKNSAGFVTKLQPGVAEGEDFRLRSGLATGEHANNRKWAANFIRQARKDQLL